VSWAARPCSSSSRPCRPCTLAQGPFELFGLRADSQWRSISRSACRLRSRRWPGERCSMSVAATAITRGAGAGAGARFVLGVDLGTLPRAVPRGAALRASRRSLPAARSRASSPRTRSLA
jgi:hypothetical protein